jgi:uncharacterized protein YbjT (DUF2867 family)
MVTELTAKKKNMKILLTGANGYVGRRLLPELLQQGHEIVCAVRDKLRLGFDIHNHPSITIWEVDFLEAVDLTNCPTDIDIAYFLIHSMSSSTANFDTMEAQTANHFNQYSRYMKIKQVIYLSGIVNDG